MPKVEGSPANKQAERDAKLAQALRSNLRRRKAASVRPAAEASGSPDQEKP
jgi:hypothetical protein